MCALVWSCGRVCAHWGLGLCVYVYTLVCVLRAGNGCLAAREPGELDRHATGLSAPSHVAGYQLCSSRSDLCTLQKI